MRASDSGAAVSRNKAALGGAARIALIYAVIGVLYIVVSDRAVALLFRDVDTITLVSTLKGWAFIFVTALLLWVMIRRHSTDLLAKEAERLDREALLSTIVDSVGGYIYVKGADYRYQFVNAAVGRLFGMSATEFIGCEDSRFLDQATAAAIRANDRRVIEYGERVEVEEVHVGTDSREARTFLSVKMPLRRKDGSIYGLCGISTDITDRKVAEAERTRLREQLVQAQKMEAIGQLTGGIAHDFNNILTSILGYSALAQQLETAKGDDTLFDYLAEIHRAGERARDLVTSMLQFSRRQAGEGAAGPLRAQPVITEVVKMLAATIPSSINIVTHVDANASSIKIDPVELHQLVTNLVINARDAIGGIGTIDITLANRHVETGTICAACHGPCDGEFVELAVTDTGSGIPPEHLHAVFEPFFTTKDVGKGTGLGLSVVHGIVHKIGGHIVVTTRPGQGTTIGLLFPAFLPPLMVGDVHPVESPAVSGPPGARIMVVDDEPALTRLLKAMLERNGMQVTTFTDSRAAWAAFDAAPGDYDLVVTDQTMPGLTGDALASQMISRRSDLPVILCSGYSENTDSAAAAAIGIRRYLTKPVATELLLQAIVDVLPPNAVPPVGSNT